MPVDLSGASQNVQLSELVADLQRHLVASVNSTSPSRRRSYVATKQSTSPSRRLSYVATKQSRPDLNLTEFKVRLATFLDDLLTMKPTSNDMSTYEGRMQDVSSLMQDACCQLPDMREVKKSLIKIHDTLRLDIPPEGMVWDDSSHQASPERPVSTSRFSKRFTVNSTD